MFHNLGLPIANCINGSYFVLSLCDVIIVINLLYLRIIGAGVSLFKILLLIN